MKILITSHHDILHHAELLMKTKGLIKIMNADKIVIKPPVPEQI
jgi:hypothetical protein